MLKFYLFYNYIVFVNMITQLYAERQHVKNRLCIRKEGNSADLAKSKRPKAEYESDKMGFGLDPDPLIVKECQTHQCRAM